MNCRTRLNDTKEKYENYLNSTTEYYQQRINLRSEISILQSKQDQAVASEDYEIAEEMNNAIDELRERLSIAAVYNRQNQDNKYASDILNQYVDLYEEQVVAYENAIRQLVVIETEEKVYIEARQNAVKEELYQLKDRLQIQEEKIKRSRRRLLLDRQHVENKENLLQVMMMKMTKD